MKKRQKKMAISLLTVLCLLQTVQTPLSAAALEMSTIFYTREYRYQDHELLATIHVPEDCVIPEDRHLKAVRITPDSGYDYYAYLNALNNQAFPDSPGPDAEPFYTVYNTLFYDLYFTTEISQEAVFFSNEEVAVDFVDGEAAELQFAENAPVVQEAFLPVASLYPIRIELDFMTRQLKDELHVQTGEELEIFQLYAGDTVGPLKNTDPLPAEGFRIATAGPVTDPEVYVDQDIEYAAFSVNEVTVIAVTQKRPLPVPDPEDTGFIDPAAEAEEWIPPADGELVLPQDEQPTGEEPAEPQEGQLVEEALIPQPEDPAGEPLLPPQEAAGLQEPVDQEPLPEGEMPVTWNEVEQPEGEGTFEETGLITETEGTDTFVSDEPVGLEESSGIEPAPEAEDTEAFASDEEVQLQGEMPVDFGEEEPVLEMVTDEIASDTSDLEVPVGDILVEEPETGRPMAYTYEDDQVLVRVTLSSPDAVPEDAEFAVTPITAESEGYNYEAYMEALNASEEAVTDTAPDAERARFDDRNTLLYDIAFYVEKTDESGQPTGEKMEFIPENGAIFVEITYKEGLASQADPAAPEELSLLHMSLDESVIDQAETTKDATAITADQIQVEKVESDSGVIVRN